jgi:hypothetical protein
MQSPLYLIKKKVHNNTYWWNEKYMRWEGWRDNATAIDQKTFDIRWGWIQRNNNDVDYEKI